MSKYDHEELVEALREEAALSRATEAVATLLPCDPYDDQDGPWFSSADLKRLAALPAGTKLYTIGAKP